ncbi:MAG: nitrate transporter, partial [Pseudomonadota bacterium]
VWKAGRWLAEGGAQTTAAEVLARNAYLDLPTEIIDRALTGRLVISPKGDVRDCPGFIEFFDGAATFPWKSQAIWIASQMAARLGLDRATAMQAARTVFRTEIYRRTLREAGAILPGASEKIEGGIAAGTAVASETGRLILAQNRFFDGQIFDPVTEY